MTEKKKEEAVNQTFEEISKGEEKRKLEKNEDFDYRIHASYILAIVSVGFGFYKMFIYEDGYSSQNYYVGGDAYNFIINANYSIAFFVLALIFVVMACTLQIINAIKDNKEEKRVDQ